MVNEVEFHSGFRFSVEVRGPGGDFAGQAIFTEFKLPSLQVEMQDVKEGGQNAFIHRLPVRVNAGTVTLKRGITKDSVLLTWYLQVLEGKIEDATRQVTVVMLDVARKPLMTWNFRNAYPIKWVGPTLKADDRAVAIEELELVHHGIEVK